MVDKTEKWQLALNNWGKWANAIDKTKAIVKRFLEKNIVDLKQLLSSAMESFKVYKDKDGVITSFYYKESLKLLILYSLKEPEFIADLQKC